MVKLIKLFAKEKLQSQAKKKLQSQKEVEHLQCQAFQKNASLDA
jgi:hypothetical protein